jgi:ribonucleoside-diphosphate reductase alpha chain
MFITHDFVLNEDTVNLIKSKVPKFGHSGLGELVYYRTYSRKLPSGEPECWNDTILRVVNGIFSILKSHMITHHLGWDEAYWQQYAVEFSEYMFDMRMLPPGRGLFSCGTNHVKTIGSTSLNNCGFVSTSDLVKSTIWTTNCLMLGCGIGFNTDFKENVYKPLGKQEYIIPDSREGWADSIGVLINSFLNPKEDLEPIFNYSQIRPSGTPIRTFGGVSSGPDPLIKLHKRIKTYLYCMYFSQNVKDINTSEYNDIKIELNKIDEEYGKYFEIACNKYSHTRLVADIFNAIGVCVVSGNVRRSSEISLGSANNNEFIQLKDLSVNPERSDVYWMSNNTCVFETTEDFEKCIPKIAAQIVKSGNGEPGLLNMLNARKFGRVNKFFDKTDEYTREQEKDNVVGCNPCGEILLESYELCNLAETFPSRCNINDKFNEEIFYKAIEYATFYASVVSLLPTHSPETNKVVARNRRIGVSISGGALISEEFGYSYLINVLKRGYKKVREINNKIMDMAGCPRSIRVTTVKPSGSISKMVGCPEGLHFSLENRYIIRRIRVAENSDMTPFLIKCGVPHEKDGYSDNTLVFDFAVDQGNIRSVNNVSVWEQLKVAEIYQKYYCDNSTSITVNYSKEEESMLEEAIALTIGNIKTLSFLPICQDKYKQAPVEAITYEKYIELKNKYGTLDLSEYKKSKMTEDTVGPKYCDGEKCTL